MKYFVLAIMMSVMTAACAAGHQSSGKTTPSVTARLDKLERANKALMLENAQLKQGTANTDPQPLVSVTPPTSRQNIVTPTTTAKAWTRKQHGAYLCIADYDSHLSEAPRIKFVNDVDANKRRKNSFLSITLNNQLVVVRSARTDSFFLKPGQECYVEKGGADQYKVRAKLYVNTGSRQYPVLDQKPDGEISPSWKRNFEDYFPLNRDILVYAFYSNHFSRY